MEAKRRLYGLRFAMRRGMWASGPRCRRCIADTDASACGVAHRCSRWRCGWRCEGASGSAAIPTRSVGIADTDASACGVADTCSIVYVGLTRVHFGTHHQRGRQDARLMATSDADGPQAHGSSRSSTRSLGRRRLSRDSSCSLCTANR